MRNLVIGIVSGAAILFLLGWLFGLWSFSSSRNSSMHPSLSEQDLESLAERLNDKIEVNMPDCMNVCEKEKPVRKAVAVVKKKVIAKKAVVKKEISCEERSEYKQCIADMRSDWDFACRKQDDGMEKISTQVSSQDKMQGNTRIEKKSVAITIDRNDEIDCSKPREFYFQRCREKVCK